MTRLPRRVFLFGRLKRKAHFSYIQSGKQKFTPPIMDFTKLVPNIFYTDITDGLRLFVDCLEFTIEHDELKSRQPFCVVAKNGLRINLFQNSELAKEHNPEFRLVTENIEEVFKKVSQSHPEFLHPNLPEITMRPWGAKEFALTDKQLGIIVQQW